MESYKKYFFSLLTISIPIIVGNISQILIGTVDVLVASRHGTNTLAAISIANAITTSIFIVGIGLLAGITPVISNYLGESRSSKHYLFSTATYSFMLASILAILTLLGLPLLDKVGFSSELLQAIKQYIFIVTFSNFGGYLFFSLKEFLQAYEILALPNALSVLAIFLNFTFNIMFVFGFGPIQPMGAVGLAVATCLVRTIMGLILLIYCLKLMDSSFKFDFAYIKQLFKVGYPIAIGLLLEFLAFNMVTILMGRISGLYAAAQSIIITIVSFVFMVPHAISNALAIKVGYANGARNYIDIKKYSLSGCIMSVIFMSFCALIIFIMPKIILNIFTNDEALLNIAIPILLIVSIFQIFDGLQVSLSGILKGLKQTLFVTIAILLGYWVIGLPLGVILAYKFNMQLVGFWVGLSVALLLMTVFMGSVLAIMFSKLRKQYSQD